MNASPEALEPKPLVIRALTLWICAILLTAVHPAYAQADESASAVGGLKDLSIEQLMELQVTSVSKTAQPVSDAAAAIYVISHEDIAHSGATSLPEILRLAPNLQVVQISASNYTVTARGFSGNSADQNFSDKLLVLIDGRSVYSPLYSGVYWDAQDVMTEDIDRIEVISGPGSTLWGANAVNGVINIITRASTETQGGLVGVGDGSFERNANAQIGGRFSDDLTYRVYAKGFEREALDQANGQDADDGWSKVQAGFRSDWNHATDAVTVQGDVYRGNENAPGDADVALSGANLLARWQRTFNDSSSFQVQSYYDQTQRFNIGGGNIVLNTYDIELQDSLDVGRSNEVVWGGGYRTSRYDITGTPTFYFTPENGTLDLSNVFAQDSIALASRLELIIGLKLEDDPYTGTSPLPEARLSWKVGDTSLLWAAASRAIRSATPFDRSVQEFLGGQLFLTGSAEFKPEKVTAYELGYRGQIGSIFSVSASGFYNVYNDLRSLEYGPELLPLQWGNKLEGDTYGVELWGNYQVLDWWRLAFGFNELREKLHFQAGSSDLLGVAQAGDDPNHQASLRSTMNFGDFTFEADLRNIGSLPNPEVPAYTEMNARLDWHISKHWAVAVSGSNLLHPYHEEFTTPPSERISRAVFADVRLKL